jgi:hypothetical protein
MRLNFLVNPVVLLQAVVNLQAVRPALNLMRTDLTRTGEKANDDI